MEKKIAIVTGASGGIGKEITKLLIQEEVDEVWAVARNQEKLDALKCELGDKIIAILCTLCIPYMKRESRILNISSASSFQPYYSNKVASIYEYNL